MQRPATLVQVQRWYKKFRKLYFSEFDIPAVEDVAFSWHDRRGLFAECDPGADVPVPITIHNKVRPFHDLVKLCLFHEMYHIAHPKADHGPKFDEECFRLGRLGALREIL